MSHTAAPLPWITVYWLLATAPRTDMTTGWSRTGKHLNQKAMELFLQKAIERTLNFNFENEGQLFFY